MNIALTVALILICIICSILQYISTYKGKIFTIIILAISLLLIINNDWEFLPDTGEYLRYFDFIDIRSSIFNVKPNYGGFEPGFMALSLIIKRIWNNHAFYLCLIFLIEYYCIYKSGKLLFEFREKTSIRTIEGETRPYYSAVFMSLWMGYFGMLYGVSVLRAGLGISIALLGLIYFYKKDYLKAAILFIFSVSMQTFSVIFVVTAVLAYKMLTIKKKSSYYFWFAACVIIWLSRISLFLSYAINALSGFLAHYIARFAKINLFYNTVLGNGFWSKKNLMFLLLALIYIYYKPHNKKMYDALLNVYMIGLTVTYLTNEMVIGYRLSDMFVIMSVPLSYYLVTNSDKLDLRGRLLLCALIVLLSFIIALRIV